MGDWLDQVQAQEQRERDQAIAAQLAQARPTGPSRKQCLDCDEDIPEARRALGAMDRCTSCMTLFEKGGQ